MSVRQIKDISPTFILQLKYQNIGKNVHWKYRNCGKNNISTFQWPIDVNDSIEKSLKMDSWNESSHSENAESFISCNRKLFARKTADVVAYSIPPTSSSR